MRELNATLCGPGLLRQRLVMAGRRGFCVALWHQTGYRHPAPSQLLTTPIGDRYQSSGLVQEAHLRPSLCDRQRRVGTALLESGLPVGLLPRQDLSRFAMAFRFSQAEQHRRVAHQNTRARQ